MSRIDDCSCETEHHEQFKFEDILLGKNINNWNDLPYFVSVGAFLITKEEIALTVWEFMTILSVPVVLFVLLELNTLMSISSVYKKVMLAFMHLCIDKCYSHSKYNSYKRSYK